jgi:hypothetical protein
MRIWKVAAGPIPTALRLLYRRELTALARPSTTLMKQTGLLRDLSLAVGCCSDSPVRRSSDLKVNFQFSML